MNFLRILNFRAMLGLAIWMAICSHSFAQPTEVISLTATYDPGSYSGSSVLIPSAYTVYPGQTVIVTAYAKNVSTYTLNVTAGANYEVVIRSVARRSITLPGLHDANGNSIAGTEIDQIAVSIVPNWRSNSMYTDTLDKMTDPTPLGSCGPITWGVPIYTNLTPDDANFNSPHLEMNMGIGRNGMALPPLKARVEISGGLLVDEYPNFPDVTTSGVQTGGGTMSIMAPQVTAIVNAGNKTVSFATPGNEGSPFLVYTFSGAAWDSTKKRYTATVTKMYTGASVTYTTTLYDTPTDYGPGQFSVQSNSWTFEDWHDSGGVQRVVSLTLPTASHPNTTGYPQATFVTVTDGSGANAPLAASKCIGYNWYYVSNGTDGSGNPISYNWYVPGTVIEDYNGNNYTTTYLPGVRGQNTTANVGQSDPDGKTRIFQYTSDELPSAVYDSWLNHSPSYAPPGTNNLAINTNGCAVTSYLYTADWNGMNLLPSSVRTKVGSNLLKETTNVYSFQDQSGNALKINGQTLLVTDSYDFDAPGSTGSATTPRTSTDGVSLHTTTKKFRDDADDSTMSGVPASILRPDGTMTSYAYEHGTIQSDHSFIADGGPDIRVTRIEGVAPGTTGATSISATPATTPIDTIGIVAGRSMQTLDLWHGGFLARHESWVNSSGTSFSLISYANYTYTADGRLTQETASSGNSLTSTWATYAASWDGDRKQNDTDSAGVVTTYYYDSMGRINVKSRAAQGSIPALRTAYGYDAESHVTSTTTGPVGQVQIVTQATYDKGGRLSHEVNSAFVTTDYVYSGGGQSVQVTVAKTTTEQNDRTTTHFADGRTDTISGSSVIYENHTYGFDTGGRPEQTIVHGSTTGRTETIYYDLLGRVKEDHTPGYASTGTIIGYSDYNSQGQPAQVRTVLSSNGIEHPIAANHVTHYDAFGAIDADGIDLNPPSSGIGALDANSTDRFTSVSTGIVQDTGNTNVWWNVVTRSTYTTDNNSTAKNGSQTYTQLNHPAYVLSNKITYDYYTNPTQETVTIDTTAHTTKQAITNPDGSQSVRTSYAGLLISEQTYSSDNSTTPVHSVTYGYDALGRAISATDSRTGTTSTDYVTGSSEVYQAHDATASPGVVVATYTYDHVGRVATVTDANSHVVSTTYNGRGQVFTQSGTGAYPVSYEYDDYGQKVTMRTYRAGGAGTADITNWTYDANTGWPTAKIDAAATRNASGAVTNPAGHQVTLDYSYDFTHGYKIVTRTWARGDTATRKFTLATGELSNVSYTSGTTVSYTYTREGRISSVTDATGTRDFNYDRGQVSSEALDTSWYAGANGAGYPGLVLTPKYESTTNGSHIPGRYAGFGLGYATTATADLDKELAVSAGYDTTGRLNAITADYHALGSRSSLSVPFTYQYYSQSGLWRTLTQGNFQLGRTLEDHRDVLSGIGTTWNSGTLAAYGFNTNPAGQRQWTTQTGSAFADLSGSYFKYTYSPVGELTSAIGYLGTDANSTATPLPGRNYGFNYDTIGNRTSASIDAETVSYNDGNGGTGGNALNEYGSRATLKTHASGTVTAGTTVTVNGASSGALTGNYWDIALGNFGQYLAVNVAATLSGQSATASVTTAFRPATENFVYDADGNLKSDAAWSYTYDSENELVTMTAVTSWGAPSRTLNFTYDYRGRRVRKVATGPNASDTYDHKYVYQGESLIAEVDSATNQIVRSFVWGMDSGPAGGGGQILQVVHTTSSLTAYGLTYDGNGNVTALVRTADSTAGGTLAAVYEYDPYGQLLRGEGTELANNPFRFGTYYTDRETGLVYYGRRFYDPTQGRFVNRDPAEEEGGLNLYSQCANNPINHWDSLGLGPTEGEVVDLKPFEVTETYLHDEGPSGFGLLQISGVDSSQTQTITTQQYVNLSAASSRLDFSFTVRKLNQKIAPKGRPKIVLINRGDNTWDVTIIYDDGHRAEYKRSQMTIFSDDGTQKRPATPEEIAASALRTDRNGTEMMQSIWEGSLDKMHQLTAGVDKLATSEGQLATTAEMLIVVVTDGLIGRVGNPQIAAGTIANPVPKTLARVMRNGINATTLGAPGAADVFVADAAQLQGLNAKQIAAKLAIPESPTGFTVITFATPGEGLATPVFRTNPGFIQGGQTAGGASEFVIPNGPIPVGATTTVVH